MSTRDSAARLDCPARSPSVVPVEEWLTVEGKLRTLGPLKDIVAGSPASCIGLHGGLPAADCFPFAGISITTHDRTVTVALDPSQLSAVQLQYNMSPCGYPPLREWAARHVQQIHAPPSPCDVMITDGNSHSLEMLTSLLMYPGDSILVEEFTYPHMLECVLLAKGAVPLPVPLDAHGMVPAGLRQALEQQRDSPGGGKPPRLLYTVPVGQNPTGAVTPLQRRKEIYQICRKFGILIIEDDPYFFLQYPQGPDKVPGIPHAAEAGSYLSLDIDGRVIRLDSFSKFFSPGLRLGWAAAQPALIERLMTMLTAQSLGASGVTQLMTWQVLSTWGDEGLECHVREMQQEYARRADIMHSAAQHELAGLAQWERPVAGMFMWVKLLGVDEAYDILPQLREAQVVVVPGRIAHPRVHDPHFECPWIRLAFSYVPDEDLREGIARLGKVLRQLQPPGQTPAPE